jgi:CheY-like chemotaxis protein
MDGYAVIKAIKNNQETYPFTRIIVISASSYEHFIKREEASSISGYIQKPIDKNKLMALLASTANEVIDQHQIKIK